MQILTIEVKNPGALKLLEDLEAMNLILVIKRSAAPENSRKLSERLAGSISAQQASIMGQELNEMRGEWERDI